VYNLCAAVSNGGTEAVSHAASTVTHMTVRVIYSWWMVVGYYKHAPDFLWGVNAWHTCARLSNPWCVLLLSSVLIVGIG
jgi:hypothetical protein